jgi:type VI protein secretion system component Hcp
VLSFDFTRFSHGHVGSVSEGYDFSTATAFNGPAPKGDVDTTSNVAPEVGVGTELQYLMRVSNVTQDWVELDGFSLGFENSGSGDGRLTGRVAVEDVVVAMKGSSAAAVKLTEAIAKGTHLGSVEIQAYRAGGEGQALVESYKFTDVVLSSLQTSAGELTSNQLSFDYAKVGHSHFEADLQGGTGDETRAGFDARQGEATNAGGGGAESRPQLEPSPHDLDYYAFFEGVGGGEWLRLESFSMGLSSTIDGSKGAGKLIPSEVTLQLGASGPLVELGAELFGGQHIKLAEIEAYRAGGGDKAQLVDEFRFENVLVTSLHSAGVTDNVLSFDFTRFSHGHVGSVSEGYDFSTATAFNGPAPDADIFFF